MATRTAASYDTDVIAWANEQARLLRARDFAALDIEHIADEVEDVGKSEARELANRLALLLAHLLKWQVQPERRGTSWETTIHAQRRAVLARLRKTPSLKADMADDEYWELAWGDAVAQAEKATGIRDLPGACPWPRDAVLDADFMPG